ncbi:MAG: outer membrane protein assembly factor BamD, partial [Pyrinomonadaceae bacterium]|nr:outer membrane protein assembly factor BamD [Pyrinomonadaceae bacterium]
MRFRRAAVFAGCVLALSVSCAGAVFAQGGQPQQARTAQGEGSPAQRVNVMLSRLDALRRSLNSALANLNSADRGSSDAKSADDPRTRLRGLEREVSSVSSEVNDLRGKLERAEKYDATQLDKLETSVADLNERVQAGLRATAGERRSGDASSASSGNNSKKKKGSLFGRLLGRGGDDKYGELTGTVAPGRDRELFEIATREARKSNYDEARLLYNTIITTYPESLYLPLAKLAVADTFYLEGTTSALIQANAAYRDWLTFFPTDPLADDVMLKMAECEMRQMGLPDRDISHARKAEQQLRVLLQQFPDTGLRPEVNKRLSETQENLAMYNLKVGNFYYERYERGVAPNPRGAQSRYREIIDKYPNFSYYDAALFRLAITYVQEEEPDEAAKYFQQLLRDYPNSEYADKAREQLEAIGAPVPQPDPARANNAPPERPSLTEKIFSEVLGRVSVTVNKDGVLISRDNEDNDLIAQAIARGGKLPDNVTPTAPVQRRAPARNIAPAPSA